MLRMRVLNHIAFGVALMLVFWSTGCSTNPSIESQIQLSPKEGPLSGGTKITLSVPLSETDVSSLLNSKNHYSLQVQIGSKDCLFVKAEIKKEAKEKSLQVSCITPPGNSSGLHNITIKETSGLANFDSLDGVSEGLTLSQGFNYNPDFQAPLSGVMKPFLKLESLSPQKASKTGGALVSIQGVGFQSSQVKSVLFGSNPCTGITVIDDNHLNCHVPPANTIGAVDVILTNSNNKSSTLPKGFTYTCGEWETVFDKTHVPSLLGRNLTPVALAIDKNDRVYVLADGFIKNLMKSFLFLLEGTNQGSQWKFDQLGTTEALASSIAISPIDQTAYIVAESWPANSFINFWNVKVGPQWNDSDIFQLDQNQPASASSIAFYQTGASSYNIYVAGHAGDSNGVSHCLIRTKSNQPNSSWTVFDDYIGTGVTCEYRNLVVDQLHKKLYVSGQTLDSVMNGAGGKWFVRSIDLSSQSAQIVDEIPGAGDPADIFYASPFAMMQSAISQTLFAAGLKSSSLGGSHWLVRKSLDGAFWQDSDDFNSINNQKSGAFMALALAGSNNNGTLFAAGVVPSQVSGNQSQWLVRYSQDDGQSWADSGPVYYYPDSQNPSHKDFSADPVAIGVDSKENVFVVGKAQTTDADSKGALIIRKQSCN